MHDRSQTIGKKEDTESSFEKVRARKMKKRENKREVGDMQTRGISRILPKHRMLKFPARLVSK